MDFIKENFIPIVALLAYSGSVAVTVVFKSYLAWEEITSDPRYINNIYLEFRFNDIQITHNN